MLVYLLLQFYEGPLFTGYLDEFFGRPLLTACSFNIGMIRIFFDIETYSPDEHGPSLCDKVISIAYKIGDSDVVVLTEWELGEKVITSSDLIFQLLYVAQWKTVSGGLRRYILFSGTLMGLICYNAYCLRIECISED